MNYFLFIKICRTELENKTEGDNQRNTQPPLRNESKDVEGKTRIYHNNG